MNRSCALPCLISSAVKTSAPQIVTISPDLMDSLAKVPLPPSGEGPICSRGSIQAVFLYSLIESYAKGNSQSVSFFARAKDDPIMTSDKDLEPRQTGPSVGDHNQGAFSFQGGNVTADNTQGDVVGRDKITHVYNAQPKDRFPDIQIYLDLQGAGVNPLTPVTAMEHVIRDYHP